MFVYLASPYSHDSKDVREVRYRRTLEAILEIAKLDIPIYSPIVHWHPLATVAQLPSNFEFWQKQNDPMVTACSEVWVYSLDGWRQSRGIDHEMRLAVSLALRVRYLSADLSNLIELADLYATAYT